MKKIKFADFVSWTPARDTWSLFFKATLQVFTLHSTLYSAKLAETVFLPGFFVLALCKYLIQKTEI